MDKVTQYRGILKRILSESASLSRSPEKSGIETLCAFDEEHDQYLLLSTGWRGQHRQRGTHLYARIRGG